MNRSREKRREALIEQESLGTISASEALELEALNAEIDAELDAEFAGFYKPIIERLEKEVLKREQLNILYNNVRIALQRADRGEPLMKEVAVGEEQFAPPLTLVEVALSTPLDLRATVDQERRLVVFDWSRA